MRYLLLSVLVVCVIGVMIPNAFAITYTDPNNRFSIEYPTGWLKQFDDNDFRVLDKFYWDAYISANFVDDVYYVGTSDSNILREMEKIERDTCNSSSYQDDGFICYNYKLNDVSVAYTEENRKAYFIDQQYSKQYSDPDYPGEFLMRSTVLEVHDGNGAWYIFSEINPGAVDQYLGQMIRSSYSFNLLQGVAVTQSTSTPSYFFQQYTDPNNRFSIEYPTGWTVDENPVPDILVRVLDTPYRWNTYFNVEFYDDIDYVGTSDSNIFQLIKDYEREFCTSSSYQEDDFICYDYEVNYTSVVYTEENRKAYFIDQQYKKQYSLSERPGEYLMRSTVLEIHDGNDIWLISTEMENCPGARTVGISTCIPKDFEKVNASALSFKLLNGQPVAQPSASESAAKAAEAAAAAAEAAAAAAEAAAAAAEAASTGGGGCLIATAAFGSEMAPQVQFLRELRDNTVLQTESGTSFMTGFNQFYYSFSPAIADYERENPAFKEAVKLTLTPLLTSLTLLQYADIDSESEMLGYGIGIILLNIGMYFVAPAVLIMAVRKRI
jgi:hypothetical protein